MSSSTLANKIPVIAQGESSLRDCVRELAYTRGPNAKLPTTRELCQTFGTNTVALNNVLRELEAQQVIFRKDRSGIFVSPFIHRKSILVLLDSTFFQVPDTSPFWGMLWGALANEAQQRAETRDEDTNFHMVTSWKNESVPVNRTLAEAIHNGQVHGVLGVGLAPLFVDWLESMQLPLVSFAGPGPYQVTQDTTERTFAGVKELARRGCRLIALLKPIAPYREISEPHPEDNYPAVEEFKAALKANGLAYHANLVRDGRHLLTEYAEGTRPLTVSLTHQQQGQEAISSLFGEEWESKRPRPDGLLITDDLMANGALITLQKMGIQPRRDIQIATHSNQGSTVLYGYEENLILLEHNPKNIARDMFDLLEAVMAGRAPAEPTTNIPLHVRTPSIVERL